MGDLRPLGSEKLQGMDKINRILEIARYNEKTPTSVNESTKSEYNLSLADGNTYEIVKEKNGYIIKKSINESETEYIDPIENRRYHKSYSAALRKLNLMAKEMNELYDNSDGVSLFSEQKKFVLKTPKPSASELPTPEPAPAPAPLPEPSLPAPDMGGEDMGAEAPDMGGEDMGAEAPDMGGEDMGAEAPDMGGEDMGAEAPDMGGEDMGAEAPDMGGEDVTFKSIQKLVGKLGQKLRAIGDKEEMTSKDLKYVINSVISAIDLTKLDDEDKEEIMSKFEPEEGDYGVEPEVDVEKDVDIEEPMPTDGESEMKEEESGSLGDKFVKSVGTRMAKGLMNTLKGGEMEEDEKHGLDDIINGLFESSLAESKVDKVLSKYFKISESEKKIIKEKTSNTLSEIKRLSETKKQKEVSEKIYSKVPTIKLIGKTNKKNLVFEHKNKQIKVSPEGRVL